MPTALSGPHEDHVILVTMFPESAENATSDGLTSGDAPLPKVADGVWLVVVVEVV